MYTQHVHVYIIRYTIIIQMEAITSYGLVFPVSVWMKKFVSSTPDPRVIIVIEPVERTSLYFTIDNDVRYTQ